MIAADTTAAAGMTTTAVPAVMTMTTGAAEAGSGIPAAMLKPPVADGTSVGEIVTMMIGAATQAAKTTTMIAVPDMTTMTADAVGMAIPAATRKLHGADGTSDATMIMTTVADIPIATMIANIRAGTMIVARAVGVMAVGSATLAAMRKLPAGVGKSAGTMISITVAVARE